MNGDGKPVFARLIDIGKVNDKWGERLCINAAVNGRTSRLFGSAKQLAEHVLSAGYEIDPESVEPGLRLNLACRVRRSVTASCASAFQKLLIQSVLRVAMMSPYTAREKELVLRAWVRFLKGGLRFGGFSRRLYEHLHLHCQFIAHYDRAGFKGTYFECGEDFVRFLSQFDGRGECRSVEYGMTLWLNGDYGDLAKAMIEEAAPRTSRSSSSRPRPASARSGLLSRAQASGGGK